MRNGSIISICFAIALFALFWGCSDSESPTPVSPGHDVSPPATIVDAGLTFSEETGTAHLEWTAPHDDSSTEKVTGYEIRYTYTDGYVPPNFWARATPVDNPPEPLDPGTPQQYTFDKLKRARDLYVGIRSVDERGNWSACDDPVTVYLPGFVFAGRCLDVFTRMPLEGLEVTVATGTAVRYTTDANGEFVHQTDLDAGVTHVEIHSGASNETFHPLSQALVLYDDSVHTFLMIPVEPVQVTWIANLLSLLKLFVPTVSPTSQPGQASAPTPAILAKWHDRPVPCYIPPFVNEHGLDYQYEAKRAAQRWMDRTGEPLFLFVDAPPDTGIILTYEITQGSIGVTIHTRGDDGHPIRDEIQVTDNVSNAFTLYIIFLHELGHTISLGHVNDQSLIMYGGHPLPVDISDDEARVVQLHEGLPTRIDLSIYNERVP